MGSEFDICCCRKELEAPVQGVFVLGVVEDLADARIRVQQLPLDVRRVDRLNQQLCLQKNPKVISGFPSRCFWSEMLANCKWTRPVSRDGGCGLLPPSSPLAATWPQPSWCLTFDIKKAKMKIYSRSKLKTKKSRTTCMDSDRLAFAIGTFDENTWGVIPKFVIILTKYG